MAITYKKSLDSITPFKPARSLESVRREFGITEIIKLAGNENNHGFSPLVHQAILNLSDSITRYPDPYGTSLREVLARHLGIREDELLFGNGSFELISLVAQAFLEENTEAVMPVPSFGWYTIATKAENATPVLVPLSKPGYTLDLEGMLGSIGEKTRVLWFCNPNNPTGTYIPAQKLEGFLWSVPSNVVVVLDEAYIDFVAEDKSRSIEFIQSFPNIISLRTFSKVYGLASLRIGYAIANPGLIDKLSRIRSPVNTNAIAQAAALAALKDEAFYSYVVSENEKGRQLYYATLERLGLPYLPSQCNFIMLDTGQDSEEIEYAFLKEGILIRGGKEFGMPTWIRITIGTEKENLKVLGILERLQQRRI
ncbi:MAG: histidinol-phosphate transaminase [Treponema sp.]|jgi:histidinol-phosphate aminotransferase|nr:histidinol-phosphate transaminase [Treponema sp.]